MKKISMIALLMALITIFAALVGCTAPQQTPAEEVPVVDPAAGNEPAAVQEGEGAVAADGISMMPKPKTLNLEMEEIIFLIDNQSGMDFSTDMVQKLEVLKGENWEEVNPVSDAVTMNLIAVPSGSMTEIPVFLKGYYEGLEKGSYRLTKVLVTNAGASMELVSEFDLF